MPVRLIRIQKLEHGEGGIQVLFGNDWYWIDRFASFSVLKHALRNWRNLYGADLVINGEPAGKVGYRNPALVESVEGEEDDPGYKDVGLPAEPEVASLETMMAAEPNFFDKKTNKLFGTKKRYKYGNCLVLKNVSSLHGHLGGTGTYTRYVIYEFIRTENSPKGVMLYRQIASSLWRAKQMIKRKDWRPWGEQVADDYRLGLRDLDETREEGEEQLL